MVTDADLIYSNASALPLIPPAGSAVVQVTKPYLPNRAQLDGYIDQIYRQAWLTNNGPLVQLLTQRLKAYLGVENLLLVGNGTIALQIAYRALRLCGQVITTPFSFVATTSSLAWEGLQPVFSDIHPHTYCLQPRSIEQAITRYTSAIVPTHVFGNACDVRAIDELARRHDLKVVYDGAHAFGVQLENRSLLLHGDATTLSFHATKLFHSIEGGAIIFRDWAAYERARAMINFGIEGPERIASLGINGKMNEFQAAMGLSVLDEMETILNSRRSIWELYVAQLQDLLPLQTRHPLCTNNYGYFPVLCPNEQVVLSVSAALQQQGINPRRYFYPSLDSLAYLQPQPRQRVSRDIASRILCLPIYPGLRPETIETITQTLKACMATTSYPHVLAA